jgi:hypothetical protein
VQHLWQPRCPAAFLYLLSRVTNFTTVKPFLANHHCDPTEPAVLQSAAEVSPMFRRKENNVMSDRKSPKPFKMPFLCGLSLPERVFVSRSASSPGCSRRDHKAFSAQVNGHHQRPDQRLSPDCFLGQISLSIVDSNRYENRQYLLQIRRSCRICPT